LWTNRSAAQLADELSEQGHSIDRKTVQRILSPDSPDSFPRFGM